MPKPNDCQMRSLIRGVACGIAVAKGTVFWTDAERAKWMVDQRIAEPIGKPEPGPSEFKPVEPAEKKSFPAAQGGRLTDSVQSIESGAALPSASQAAPASAQPTPSVFRKRGRTQKSE